MPDSTLSQAIREAYASAPDNVVLLHTLEFRHAAFTAPIRVVLDHANLTATLEADAPLNGGEAVEFIAYAFDLALPEVAERASPEVIITIDNVSGEISANLDGAASSASPIEVTYRPYLSTDLSGPQMDPPMHLTVRHVEVDMMRVTARASFGDLANRRFPGQDYTAARFPGLIR